MSKQIRSGCILYFFICATVWAQNLGLPQLLTQYEKKSSHRTWNKTSSFIQDKDLPAPFWLTKPEVYKKVQGDRLIPVSVQVTEQKPPVRGVKKSATDPESKKKKLKVNASPQKSLIKHQLKMVAGAWVNVPFQETYNFAKEFKNYLRVSEYVQEVQVIDSKKLMYASTKAFGQTAEFLMQTYVKQKNKKSGQIQWRIVGGLFSGMVVVFDFKDVGRRRTEISMTALYKFHKLPLAQFFVEFGLEVIMQKAGAHLRSLVESDYKGSSAGLSL